MIDLRQGTLSDQMAALHKLAVGDRYINQQGQTCVIKTFVKNEAGEVVSMESITTDPSPKSI